jgi:uncharacterized membrane protein
VDIVRGLIMIVMALDHTRDYLGTSTGNPSDPATVAVALFLTRWITHICAPVFFLLTGTGARLSLGRKTRAELSRFLWTRGLWLLFLDAVVLRCLAYQFNFDFHLTLLIVLWALGWAMIALAALICLPNIGILLIGAVMVAGHNLLDGVAPASFGALAPLWSILHVPAVIVNAPGHVVFETYPLIPWVGVTALGWCLGAVYGWPVERRRRLLLWLGWALVVAFVGLRALNGYGDPSRWTVQQTTVRTLLSFVNTTKYPPSLLFLLMTLGPALLLLCAAERRLPTWSEPVRVVGKVPLFYFAVHFVLIHLVAIAVSAIRFGTVRGMFESATLAHYPITAPPGWGFSLPGVWLSWIAVVIVMYPLCRWYAGVKDRRRDWWLSYL